MLISILIRAGRPRELWNNVIDGKVELVISEELLEEFNEVIFRPEFRRYLKRSRIAKFQRTLIQIAEMRRVKIHLSNITEDPDDNMILEAAYSGKADYIVSGDKHLLKLEDFKGIRIVTVDEMLKILKRKGRWPESSKFGRSRNSYNKRLSSLVYCQTGRSLWKNILDVNYSLI